jgi:TatD DNase family protein
MIDTHAHITYAPLAEEIPSVLQRAHAAGVDRVIIPGTNIESSRAGIMAASQYAGVFAAAGVHPCDIFSPQDHLDLVDLLETHPEIVAVGEIGLDHFHLKKEDVETQKEAQVASFLDQLALAKRFYKPVIIHTRDSFEDAYKILLQEAKEWKVVIHCFTGSLEEARAWIDAGFYLSLTGILTYKNSQDLRDVVQELPLERLMIETDAPYLAPQGYRGKACEPAYVVEVARCMAELYSRSVEEIDAITTLTAEAFFGLSKQ